MIVSRDAFSSWLGERPHLPTLLLRALSRRVRYTDQLMADFTFVDLPQRLARRILDLCSAQGVRGAQATQVKVTQLELSSMLAVSRESVNKELQALAEAGLLRTMRGAIAIENLAALQAFASYGSDD